VAGSCECGDEPSGSGATELASLERKRIQSLAETKGKASTKYTVCDNVLTRHAGSGQFTAQPQYVTLSGRAHR
jgi:hypothetical protein